MQDSREEGWILKKENKEERGGEGNGMEEDGNGWMDGVAGGGGLECPCLLSGLYLTVEIQMI